MPLSKEDIQEVERVRKLLAEHLSENVALFDCEGSCPDEVALNKDLRSDEYCNWCFAGQIFRTIGSIPSKDQSLPRNPFFHTTHMNTTYPCKACVIEEYQQDMKDFERRINIEEYDR